MYSPASTSTTTATQATSAEATPSSPPQKDNRPHTVLIDGSHLFFRAFHAFEFNRAKGAIYGLTRSLMKILAELKPYDHIGKYPTDVAVRSSLSLAVCFDPVGRKTFRDKLYPEYKKNRVELSEECKKQLEMIPDVLKAFNVPFVRSAEFEADDVIATYAKQAEAKGHRVTLVSQDKDLMQLITDNVQVWDSQNTAYIGTDTIPSGF